MKTLTTTFFSTLDKDQTKDCLKFLVFPWRWFGCKKGKYIKQAEDEMKNYIGAKEVYSFYNGRAALYYALKVSCAGNGDEVIIQAYTCVSVPNAIIEAGAKPIYCDIDESLNLDPEELAKKITDKTKAVIVQHTFGNPARIDEIKEVLKNYQSRASIDKFIPQDTCLRKIPPTPPLVKGGIMRKIILIEDCAHSLGAKYDGKLVGTFGDISMFSFGRDKVISSINGGMLCVNNKELLPPPNFSQEGNTPLAPLKGGTCTPLSLKGEYAEFPPYSLIVRNLLYPILATISLKWYNKGKIGKSIMYAAKKLKLIPLILNEDEKNGYSPTFACLRRQEEGARGRVSYKMPNSLAYLFLQQFKKLEEYNNHRLEIAEFYNNALRGTEFKFPKVWDKSEQVYLRYTLFAKNAEEIIKKARKNDIYLGDWYRNVIAPKGVNLAGVLYEQNTCSKAERYASQSVNLSNHSGISIEDAGRVVDEIDKFT